MAKGPKTNALAVQQATTETTISDESAYRAFEASLVTFKGAELHLCSAVAATLLLTCHLQPTDKRKRVDDVRGSMEQMVKDLTDVKRSQMKLYGQLGQTLYQRLVTRQQFGGVVQSVAALGATQANEATTLIANWLVGYRENKQFPDGIRSMEALRIVFGGKRKASAKTRETAPARIGRTSGESIADAEDNRPEVIQAFASEIVAKSPDAVAFILAQASELDNETLDVLCAKLETLKDTRTVNPVVASKVTEARVSH